MKNTPYDSLPDHCFWPRAVAAPAQQDIDPLVAVPFVLDPDDKIVTAGSCFAQHIARRLKAAGWHCLLTEPPHEWLHEDEADAYQYGMYTARYGNIYTARQLLQLFQRAYGSFHPAERVWQHGDRSIDPFRPRIQPDGFASPAEFEADQVQHFAAVREAFDKLDVFIFTLGLTEAWESVADGAVFPLCPGVAGGSYDAQRHRWRNFSTAEVVADMLAFIDLLRAVNPSARLILSVSPVALAATASPTQHVLTANCYSKSVLRVACAELVAQRPDVFYMPSYEIITGQHARDSYFSQDLRSVNEAGVNHVMRVFFKHLAQQAACADSGASAAPAHLKQMEQLVRTNCDEDALLQGLPATPPSRQLCNLCGGEEFSRGPGGRLSKTGRLPHCAACGSLERQRAAAALLQTLHGSDLDWRRALLAGAAHGADRRWFRECDLLPAPVNGALPLVLASGMAAAAGVYDLITAVYLLELLEDDQAGFDHLLQLLSPRGLLQICFADPDARELTSARAGPAGGMRRWYGRDLERHFRCRERGIAMSMVDAADPATGESMPVHFFRRQA